MQATLEEFVQQLTELGEVIDRAKRVAIKEVRGLMPCGLMPLVRFDSELTFNFYHLPHRTSDFGTVRGAARATSPRGGLFHGMVVACSTD